MPRIRLGTVVLVLVPSLVFAACGGGGQGFRVPNDPLVIQTATLPPMMSGEAVNEVLALSGGSAATNPASPGPYVLSVINGRLPDGIGLNNQTHAIEGFLLEGGQIFDFTIQVVDTGCDPFCSSTQHFTWDIGIGPLKVVTADPPFTPADANGPGDPQYAELKSTVYGSFATHRLIVAGGVPPYTGRLVDSPAIPNDRLPPSGVVFSEPSLSFVGAPGEVGPGGGPFIMSIEVTDGRGEQTVFTCQWQVRTPPIIVATTTLATGKCGEIYSEVFTLAEGVPPFDHHLVQAGLPDPYTATLGPADVSGDVVFDSSNLATGGLPVINAPAGTAALTFADSSIYPPQNELGPDYRTSHSGAPPEGISIYPTNGTFAGIPRRRGTFRIHYLARSTLVPKEYGQHAWKSFDLFMAVSEPPTAPKPAFAQLPGYTVEGAFQGAPYYSTIPEFEVGIPYDPVDGLSGGLELLAHGGVPKDGKTDAPHIGDVVDIDGFGAPPAAERAGGYDWEINWDPVGDGPRPPTTPPPGISLVSHLGLLKADETLLQRQGFQEIQVTALDDQLPVQVRNQAAQIVRLTIGPDLVVITESTTSTTTTYPYYDTTYNDEDMKVRIIEASSTPVTRDLDDNATDGNTAYDMTATHTLPSTVAAGTSLQSLLTGFDSIRTTVNPAGYWDDVYNLNANGSRAFQHGERQSAYSYLFNYYYIYYHENPSVTAVDVPECTAPTGVVPAGASLTQGIYRNGGKLYTFDSSTHIGVFIVRPDSKIYVPMAFSKSGTGFQSFGDAWHNPYSSSSSHGSPTKMCAIATSADGRFAAMKLKAGSYASWNQSAAASKIVLFSLTGEKLWGGGTQTYIVLDTGSNGTSSQGAYFYANSMVLTSQYLYYLCGNWTGKYSTWRDHYIYRYNLTGGTSAGTLLSSGLSGWTNTAGSPMQTPFHLFDDTRGLTQVFLSSGTFATLPGDSTTYNPQMFSYSGANSLENSPAPMPFRVSRNGKACAILAAPMSASTTGTDVMSHHMWVDYDGTLYKVSSTARHAPHGAGRGYTLARGPNAWFHWGLKSGPTTAMEISDDGLKVAWVVNRDSGSINGTVGGDSDSNWDAREDIVAARATNGSSWSGGVTEIQVTGSESATAPIFDDAPTAYLWRFGSLVFTKDGNGLVFWGGCSGENPTSTATNRLYSAGDLATSSSAWTYSGTSYMGPNTMFKYIGTLYSYNFSNGQVRSLLATADGGGTDGQKLYSASAQVAPSTTAWSGAPGLLFPVGGFVSKSQDFFYMATNGGRTSSDSTNLWVVGVNIRSLNTSATINGHADGLGFRLGNWPANYGFAPAGYYYSPYYCDYGYYGPLMAQGFNLQTMAKQSGHVFFGTHYQYYNGGNASQETTGSFATGPVNRTNWLDYGAYGGEVFAFAADIGGPIQKITNPSLGSTTSYLTILYVEPSDSGRQVAFGTSQGSTTRYTNQENVGYAGNIDFDATGTLGSGLFRKLLQTSTGRGGESVAHDFTSTKLYYAFGSSSNENTRNVVEATFNSATGNFTNRTVAGTARRYNVLHAGR